MHTNMGEGKDVLDKYGTPNGKVDGDGTDTVAFTFFSPEGALYWLPYFIEYIRDNFENGHDFNLVYSHVMFKLSDRGWVFDVKEITTDEERGMIREYLQWVKSAPEYLGNDYSKAEIDYAIAIWSIDPHRA